MNRILSEPFCKFAFKIKIESTSSVFLFSLQSVAAGESRGKQDMQNNGEIISGNTIRYGSSLFCD